MPLVEGWVTARALDTGGEAGRAVLDRLGADAPPVAVLALQPARDRELVARAERLRDDRIERHEHAHSEQREHEVVEIAERDRCERLRRHAPDHDRVDHAHQHRADLDQHDRRGEPQ